MYAWALCMKSFVSTWVKYHCFCSDSFQPLLYINNKNWSCDKVISPVCFLTESKETAIEKQLKEEEKILESVADKTALKGVAELAKGIEYTDPIKTGYVNECYVRASYTYFRCRSAAAGQYGIACHPVTGNVFPYF